MSMENFICSCMESITSTPHKPQPSFFEIFIAFGFVCFFGSIAFEDFVKSTLDKIKSLENAKNNKSGKKVNRTFRKHIEKPCCRNKRKYCRTNIK